jgi:hypothetical protein
MDGETQPISANETYEKSGTASAAADVRRSEVFNANLTQQETRKWPAKAVA